MLFILFNAGFFLLQRKKNHLKNFFWVYTFIIYALVTSYFRTGPVEYYFITLLMSAIGVLFAGLQGVVVFILAVLHSLFILKKPLQIDFYIYSLAALAGIWTFVRLFIRTETDAPHEELEHFPSIEYGEEFQEQYLKTLKFKLKKKFELVKMYDEDFLIFIYVKKGDNMVLTDTNERRYLRAEIGLNAAPLIRGIVEGRHAVCDHGDKLKSSDYFIFNAPVALDGIIIERVTFEGFTGMVGICTGTAGFAEKKDFYRLYLNDIIGYFTELNLYKSIIKQREEFNFFFSTLSALNREEKLDRTAAVLEEKMRSEFGLVNFNFIEYDNCRYRIVHSTSKNAITNAWFNIEQDHYLTSVIAQGRHQIITDLRNNKNVQLKISGSVDTLPISKYLIVMIVQALSKHYVILAETKKNISENERNMVDIIVENLRRIIENRALFEKFSGLAIRDGLTGLYNHKKFQELIEEHLEHSKSPRREFCIMMMDIDHFKQFNDTYGHKAGDIVIMRVAEALRRSLRPTDALGTGYAGNDDSKTARYGGEEFIALIPDADLRRGRDIAERLRKNIEGMRVDIINNVVRVTVSIGLSHYPSMGLDKNTLIEKADKGLYLAKNNGRNQVQIIS